MNYIMELNEKLKQAELKYETAYQAMLENPTMDNISRRNDAYMNLITARSRIDHLGKNRDGGEEYSVPRINLNSNY
ncbi:MAG TPA: hypothetical protein PLP27_06425 [Crocinitomicaceae bacterium]|nr:hypothetical protein [Crocinitomicaceae bacterium]